MVGIHDLSIGVAMRVGVIYSDQPRSDTTGQYALRALRCLTEAVHIDPGQLESVGPNDFELFLRVDDGLDYQVPDRLKPLAFWAIDTHLMPDRCLMLAQQADIIFAAQKSGAEKLAAAGISNVHWLPLACDPEVHGRRQTDNRFDVAFVGHVVTEERKQLIQLLQQNCPRSFFGQADYREMAEIYSAAKIVFNRSVRDDINMRVFEGLCSGAMVITNDLAAFGQNDLFCPGEHLVTYRSDQELLDRVAFFLQHPQDRDRIARNGWDHVLRNHTYLHRMQELLRVTARHFANLRTVGGDGSRPAERNVSACLISWKRPEQLCHVVTALLQEPRIDDIVIWNNNPDISLQFADERVNVVGNGQNMITYGRYLATQFAKHDTIYTQDDDCLVHNIGELIETYDHDPSRMAHTLKLGHLLRNPEHVRDGAQMGLVGWGAVYHRDWVNVLNQYKERHGEDRFLVRDADRLFTVLQHRRHRTLLADVVDLEGAEGPEAMSVQADHVSVTQEAIDRAHLFLRETRSREVNANRCPESSREPVQPQASSKSKNYYEFARPDVLELVPNSARRVLDIGCGSGNLGAALRSRQQAHVTGIELNPQAAEVAAQKLNDVIVDDIQSPEFEFPPGTFDCVICADILEHVRDPLSALRKIRRWLTPAGSLVTSIPNVRNHQVIRSLLAGNWTYESAGLLDEDHVRFFTRREIEKLLFRAGFDIRHLTMIGGEGFSDWVQQGSPLQLKLGPFQLRAGSAQEAAEFFAYQYLAVAAPAVTQDFGLTSIILVTHNQWRHTQTCLESIRLRTDLPYELIVVDNASTDGTPEFLHSDEGVQLIRNATNRGFPAAVNQGISVARGNQVLLLNNDTIVTTGWLERLLSGLHREPAVGLVGPVTNRISGEQQVAVAYDELSQLDGFAWDWGTARTAEAQDTDRLVGFCLLIKREVINRIGLFDERFGIGNFEDDDYCRRAIEAGYRCAIIRSAFIHHVGSATFRNSGIAFDQLLRENQQKYHEKWDSRSISSSQHKKHDIGERSLISRQGRDDSDNGPPHGDATRSSTAIQNAHEGHHLGLDQIPRGSHCRPQFLFDVNDSGDLLLRPNTVKLSGCLIVRDNEHTIRPCLESLRPWVDEIVVVDTGSLDRTPQICEELGARVLHSPWQDSFSQARNVSLSLARGEWIFWMDSDDTLPEHCGKKLRELVDGPHGDNLLGYIAQVHCPGESPDDVTVVDHVKLIRNLPDLRFEFHIHEQILPAIRRLGGEVAWTDLHVVHSGSDKTPTGRTRKLDRDFRLLALDLAERPDHPFVLFNLGMTHADAGNHPEAVRHLIRCIEVSGSQESHLRKAYALLIGSLMQLTHLHEAQTYLTAGLRHFPVDTELLFRQAMLQHRTGQLEHAAETYQRLLTQREDRHFTSIDSGLADHKTRHNLAIVYEDLGLPEQAKQHWKEILKTRPNYAPAKQALSRRPELSVPEGELE
ncbi:MAG: glycosyltransferase [Planctomycetaceae bacterium]|nr:glycosyltransferase [Planctomycetaceae bacterium]